MRIGILGSGVMGGKLGTIFARAGHDVVFNCARSKEKLKKLEAQGNARVGAVAEAVKDEDATDLERLPVDVEEHLLVRRRGDERCPDEHVTARKLERSRPRLELKGERLRELPVTGQESERCGVLRPAHRLLDHLAVRLGLLTRFGWRRRFNRLLVKALHRC